MKKMLLLLTMAAATTATAADVLTWYDGHSAVTYHVETPAAPVVEQALSMFAADMALVTGQQARSQRQDATILIYQLDRATAATRRRLQAWGVPTEHIAARADAFCVTARGSRIIVAGSNARGCAYGVLELSRLAGVSPWVWWGDVVPERRELLTLDAGFTTEQAPSVDYRGVFINDEDWSLRPWATQTHEPGAGRGVIGPQTYKALFQLLLRLRANALWPAMHEGTAGFFTVEGNKEMADSFAILVGSSHCEPLLRNNVAEWDVSRRGPYNYITNREQVQRYWAERLEQVRGSEELFTIGMRGIHDGSMEGVKTPGEKLQGLQQVIDDQRQLIARHYDARVSRVPQVFIPYKEVLEIMESGLRVPDDVTLMWCDDNYGYMTRLSDSLQQQRPGGGGVYYHLSYWGRPHDYLWLTTTQPGLVYNEMRAAYDHNCRRLWIVNIHDPKVAAYQLELFLDMAWDIDALTPQTLNDHHERWLATQFGPEAGRLLAPAMRQFYQLCAVRRPEFMGWTQVELDKRVVPGGKSTIAALELTQQEAADRVEAFGRIKATVDKCRLLVRPELADAYFAHVVYPVHAAAAMTAKVAGDSAWSHQAYTEIQQLTAHYNAMGGGRWNGLMDAAPRRLPVYADAHGQLATDSTTEGIHIARNASQWSAYTPAPGSSQQPTVTQMLGHSMSAVGIPRGAELAFTFDSPADGQATLYTAMIPTQPNDKGDLRYELRVDEEEPVVVSLKEKYRSEGWKRNVLRGQALKATPVSLGKGSHTLRVRALDDHIIMDQWMLDFSPGRPFYVIPVQP